MIAANATPMTITPGNPKRLTPVERILLFNKPAARILNYVNPVCKAFGAKA
jgi:hypothetical protein